MANLFQAKYRGFFVGTFNILLINGLFFLVYAVSLYLLPNYSVAIVYIYLLLSLLLTGFMLSFVIRKVHFSYIVPLFFMFTLIVGILSIVFKIELYSIIVVVFNLTLYKYSSNLYVEYSTKAILVFDKVLFLALMLSITLLSFLGRDIYSMHQLDYLVHQGVINNLSNGEWCSFPDECSSGFTVRTYSTAYHIVNTIIFNYEMDVNAYWYAVDVVLPVVGLMLIYFYLRDTSHLKFISLVAPLIVFFTLDNGAFTFRNFIPQTLAFLLTANFILSYLVQSKEIKVKQFFINTIFTFTLVFLIHFYMGIYLIIISLISLLINYLIKKQFVSIRIIKLIMVAIVSLMITISATGFSLENSGISVQSVDDIGIATNYSYPDNLVYFMNSVGLITIASLLLFLFANGKKIDKRSIILSSLIVLGFLAYLLGPSFAHKFFIGMSFFATVLFISITNNYKRTWILSVGLVLLFVFQVFSFFNNYEILQTYYKNSDGSSSAISAQDRRLILGLESSLVDNCFVISDPVSQMNLEAYFDLSSVNGLYVNQSTRLLIDEFSGNPNQSSWDLLLSNVENVLEDKDICFVYSARLKELERDSPDWTSDLFGFIFDSYTNVWRGDMVSKFFLERNASIIFENNKFLIFRYEV